MKKKFISAMAIGMCLCMGAMAGCGDNNTSSSSSSSSPAEPLTQDEILAAIGEAYEASKAYTGGYTVTGTNNWENKEFDAEEKQTGTATFEMTADPSQGLLYYKDGQDGYGYYVNKILKSGTDYIEYDEEKYESDEEADKYYSKVTEAYVKYCVMEEYSLVTLLESWMSAEIFEIESIDTYNAAYAKVFADSAAEIAAGTEDEESEYYGYTASGSATVSAVETADGAYVLTTKMTMEMSSSVENMTVTYMQETVVTAKDGKIIGLKETDEETETKKISDTETQTNIEKDEITYTVSYTFDQAKYDGVSVTLPETVEEDEYYSSGFNLVINGKESYYYEYVSGDSVAEAVGYLPGRVLSSIGATAEDATVTLYKDAAYTQALDGTNMTEADFYALEKVYAKVELIKEGYALISRVTSYTCASDVTEEQKLIFGEMLDYSYGTSVKLVEVKNPIDMPENVKVYINGTEYAGDTFTAESGETYEIKSLKEMTKADLNIFTMMLY